MQTGEIILTVAGVAIVTVALAFYSRRQKKAAWSGRVEKMERYQDADDDEVYIIQVRTDDGKQIKMKTNAYQFGQFRTGDRIVKRAGDPAPVKVPEPAAAGPAPLRQTAPLAPRVCKQCGSEALPDESFCVKCGNRI